MAFRVLDTASGDGIVSPEDIRGFIGEVGGMRTSFDVLRPWATGVLLDTAHVPGSTVAAEQLSPKGAPTLGLRLSDLQRAISSPSPGVGWTSSAGGIGGSWSSPPAGLDDIEAEGKVAGEVAAVVASARDSRDIIAVLQVEEAI